jgi:hypothetical protein
VLTDRYYLSLYSNIANIIAIASSQFNEIKLKFGFSSLLKSCIFLVVTVVLWVCDMFNIDEMLDRDMIFHFYFIHPIGMCRVRRFLAILGSSFHSSLLYTFSCHSSPPTILPSSLTSSCYLLLDLLLGLVDSKFLYNILLGILVSYVLCPCKNQRNLCSLIFSV